jgi:hypothetical protein
MDISEATFYVWKKKYSCIAGQAMSRSLLNA